MDWFEKLTGFRETGYDDTRAKLKVEGRQLQSLINGKSYGIGELELVSLEALRERVKSADGLPGRIFHLTEFGSDLGFVNWKDIGLNPYGNSLIVNGAFLQNNPKLTEDFVRLSQRAFAACVADAAPCLKALLDHVSGLDKENQERQWERIKFLMTDDFTTTKALGWIDAERMKKDYDLVQTYLGMEKPFAVESAFSTRLLDPSVKMDASKVKN